ncbi:YlxR family protein [Candidatus Dojkabacteria bacterium]|jgi:predicted RNA-binding protein YlxR (DUF448 family)|nr:YlxR family protein [Candidatus Dojkabacteria bacterium]
MKKQSSEKVKHIAMRMCAVTREKLPKNELVRIVYLKDKKEVKVDNSGKLRGRGLNIKPSEEVWQQALQRKTIQRAFGVQLDPKDAERLKKEFSEVVLEKHTEKRVVRISSEQLSKIVGKNEEKGRK